MKKINFKNEFYNQEDVHLLKKDEIDLNVKNKKIMRRKWVEWLLDVLCLPTQWK